MFHYEIDLRSAIPEYTGHLPKQSNNPQRHTSWLQTPVATDFLRFPIILKKDGKPVFISNSQEAEESVIDEYATSESMNRLWSELVGNFKHWPEHLPSYVISILHQKESGLFYLGHILKEIFSLYNILFDTDLQPSETIKSEHAFNLKDKAKSIKKSGTHLTLRKTTDLADMCENSIKINIRDGKQEDENGLPLIVATMKATMKYIINTESKDNKGKTIEHPFQLISFVLKITPEKFIDRPISVNKLRVAFALYYFKSCKKLTEMPENLKDLHNVLNDRTADTTEIAKNLQSLFKHKWLFQEFLNAVFQNANDKKQEFTDLIQRYFLSHSALFPLCTTPYSARLFQASRSTSPEPSSSENSSSADSSPDTITGRKTPVMSHSQDAA